MNEKLSQRIDRNEKGGLNYPSYIAGALIAGSIVGITSHIEANDKKKDATKAPSPVERIQDTSEIKTQKIPGGTLVYDDKKDQYLVYVAPNGEKGDVVDQPMDPGWHKINREVVDINQPNPDIPVHSPASLPPGVDLNK